MVGLAGTALAMPAGLAECILAAAVAFHLPPAVVTTVQAVEGGRPGSVSVNSNGTLDLGPMQVNTIWIEPISAETGVPPREVAIRLRDDTCFNVLIGTWILRSRIDDAGDLETGIAHYHSRTPVHAETYLQKFAAALSQLAER